MRTIRSALHLMHPLIFENGAGIAVPDGYFEAPGSGATDTGLVPETFGPGLCGAAPHPRRDARTASLSVRAASAT
ncbi:MAG: hypothetical protein U5R48_15020 [Gammaproteobacteria bacterium]|nr:hypothetical protein [Gammaproteobacteria bacterium]